MAGVLSNIPRSYEIYKIYSTLNNPTNVDMSQNQQTKDHFGRIFQSKNHFECILRVKETQWVMHFQNNFIGLKLRLRCDYTCMKESGH